jgi:hypothetical protein
MRSQVERILTHRSQGSEKDDKKSNRRYVPGLAQKKGGVVPTVTTKNNFE